MNFDFNVYHYNYDDKVDMLVKDSAGVVKCKKAFPIYKENDREYIFKPLSKTKPYSTPLFAYSEVFWSTVIKQYFDETAPLYRLAICHGYDEYFPSRYSKGTIVESIVNPNERLVNLFEYFMRNQDATVNIEDYINYCGMYYDYTNILNSSLISKRPEIGRTLAKQILISILKNDINFHYENIAFIYEGNALKRVAPAFDHEYSLPFLFPDDEILYYGYFGAYNMTLMQNKDMNSNINMRAILNNIDLIAKKYPKEVLAFLKSLELFIQGFKTTNFSIPQDYMEPFSTELYQVYEAIYKEHNDTSKLSEIPKFKLNSLDMSEYSKNIQRDILISAVNYSTNLGNALTRSRTRK